jgi:inner membrane protein
MSPITHFLIGWCLAETAPQLDKRERTMVALAAAAPDLDGLGIVAELLTKNSAHPLLWWSEYHHIFGHNLLFAVLVSALTYALARSHRCQTAILVFVSVHTHILGDILGSRGPEGPWPILYWYPWNRTEWIWSGQWALNAWPNMVITVVCLGIMLRLAWRRGYSPLGIFSEWADGIFVSTIRARFGIKKV